MNAIDYLERGWSLNPDAICMVDGATEETYTYDFVRRQTMIFANALVDRGFRRYDKFSVLSRNDVNAFIAILGAMRAGLSYIPVNALNTISHNGDVLDRFDCDFVLYQREFSASLVEIRKRAPRIKSFICVEGQDGEHPGLDQFSEGFADTFAPVPYDPDFPYEILPTSATTGFPKGVIFANRLVESIVSNFTTVAPIDRPPVFLAVAPLTHLSGKFMQYIMFHGGTGVILPRNDRQKILECIPKYGITHMFFPPTIIYDLLTEPNVRSIDYSSLRYFMYSAAPMAPEKAREAIEVFGPVMCQIWGQSEAAWCSVLMPRDHMDEDGKGAASLERLASCGRPLPFVQMAVMDDEGKILADGERGELVVRGQNVMPSYYKNPEETSEVQKFGWHHSGDVGYRDSEGFYYIVDRKKDMIISGGFNIFSVEVETAVLAHPDVQQCAVIGVPDERWGEAVKAVVQLKQGATATQQGIIDFVRAEIGSMKAPKSVDIVEALPVSPIGKVLKREVRNRYWSDSKRMVS